MTRLNRVIKGFVKLNKIESISSKYFNIFDIHNKQIHNVKYYVEKGVGEGRWCSGE